MTQTEKAYKDIYDKHDLSFTEYQKEEINHLVSETKLCDSKKNNLSLGEEFLKILEELLPEPTSKEIKNRYNICKQHGVTYGPGSKCPFCASDSESSARRLSQHHSHQSQSTHPQISEVVLRGVNASQLKSSSLFLLPVSGYPLKQSRGYLT